MRLEDFIYIGILLNVIQHLLAGALLGGHLKNIETNDDPLLDVFVDGKQTNLEPLSSLLALTSDERGTYNKDSEINKKIFSNHRESYGPLHQPKTYKYPYPLISSSYASMKIQGANKYKNVNNKDRVIAMHRFPSNDNNIIDRIPNYYSNAVTTVSSIISDTSATPGITVTTVASSSSTSVIKKTSPTRTSFTTTTPRTTTIKLTPTTTSREEADSLFNKFLMEIFKTTDFDNIDSLKEEKYSENMSHNKTENIPPVKNSNYDDYLHTGITHESKFAENSPVEKNENFNNDSNLTTESEILIHNNSSEGYFNTISNMSNPEFVYIDYDEDNDNNFPTNQSNILDYYTDDYLKPNNDAVNLTYEKSNIPFYSNDNSVYQKINLEDNNHRKVNENIFLNKTTEKIQFNSEAEKVNISEQMTTESLKNYKKITTEPNILIQLLNQDNIQVVNKTNLNLKNTQNTSHISQEINSKFTTTPKTLQYSTNVTLRNNSENENFSISVSLLPPIDRTNQYQHHYIQESQQSLPQKDLPNHVYYHVDKLSTSNTLTKTIPNNAKINNNQSVNNTQIFSDVTSSIDSFKVPSLTTNVQNNTETLFMPSENVYILHDGETNDKKNVIQGSATLSVGIPVIPPMTVRNRTINLSTKVPSKLITTGITSKLSLDYNRNTQTNDKILYLNSQPMYHQLPTDLTPPLVDNKKIIRTQTYARPAWELKPGNYANERVDYPGPLNKIKHRMPSDLPNILPQFRPNAKISHHHSTDTIGTIHNKHMKRPLSPSSPHNSNVYPRPINNYYERSQPLRIQQFPFLNHSGHRNSDLDRRIYEKEPHVENKRVWGLPPELSRGPPRVPERHIAKTGNGSESEVSTLQMIKSMQNNNINSIVSINNSKIEIENILPEKKKNEKEDFPLYVVYPTNHSSLSLNIFNTDKSAVVVGKRGEKPNLPSEFQDGNEKKATVYAQSIGHYPHHSISTDYPVLSDFPYPIERPSVTLLSTDTKYVTPVDKPTKANEIPYDKYYPASTSIIPAAALNSGIVLGIGKEVPAKEHIAIAYTPTELPSSSSLLYPQDDYVKMDMAPQYNTDVVDEHNQNEFTVSAVMHTHPQNDPNHNIINIKDKLKQKLSYYQNDLLNQNHRIDYGSEHSHQPIKLDFQAPFQASISIDSPQEHWSVVQNKQDKIDEKNYTKNYEDSSTKIYEVETSTTNNNNFDFENFKPQLFGGFKPIIKVTTENDTNLEA